MNRRCWASRGCPWLGCVRANGGHTQLTLRKGVEVLDGICFGRSDLVDIDPAKVMSWTSWPDCRAAGSAGLETLQLEIRDVAPAGHLAALRRGRVHGLMAAEPSRRSTQVGATAAAR